MTPPPPSHPHKHKHTLSLCGRCEVVERRSQYELGRAQRRLHLVDGFLLAMQHIDDVVAVVRQAPTAAAAGVTLQVRGGVVCG